MKEQGPDRREEGADNAEEGSDRAEYGWDIKEEGANIKEMEWDNAEEGPDNEEEDRFGTAEAGCGSSEAGFCGAEDAFMVRKGTDGNKEIASERGSQASRFLEGDRNVGGPGGREASMPYLYDRVTKSTDWYFSHSFCSLGSARLPVYSQADT